MEKTNVIKIAVQGIQGSFSEQAAQQFALKNKFTHVDLEYLVTSQNVLKAIANKNCHFGVLALENSTGGVVFETIEALAKYPCNIAEYFSILVQQNLFCLEKTDRHEIKKIYSHQQALRQCKQYLQMNFPNAKQIEAEDTALSAKQLKMGMLPKYTAVIGNKYCAKLYNLKLLAENINDLKDNQTLFMAVKPWQ